MPCPNCGGAGAGPAAICLRRGNNSVVARGVDGCYTLPKIVDSNGNPFTTNAQGDQVVAAGGGGGGASNLDGLTDVAVASPVSGHILRYNGVTWVNTSAGYVPSSIVTSKGDLLVGLSVGNVTRLPLGSTGQVLTADAALAEGVKWGAPATGGGGGATTLDGLTDVTVTGPASGDVLRNNGSGQFVNTPGIAWFETVNAVANHVAAVDPHGQYVLESTVTTKGDILAATGLGTIVRVPVGGAAQVLKVNSATATGLEWGADVGIPVTLFDAKGDLLAATANDTAARLAVGANGQVLKANSSAATGLEWANETGGGGGGSDTSYSNHGNTGAAETIDYSVARTHRIVLDSATVALTFAGWPASGSKGEITLIVKHDATTSARAITWPAAAKFPNGVAPFMPTTTADAESMIVVTTVDGGTTLYTNLVGNDYA